MCVAFELWWDGVPKAVISKVLSERTISYVRPVWLFPAIGVDFGKICTEIGVLSLPADSKNFMVPWT